MWVCTVLAAEGGFFGVYSVSGRGRFYFVLAAANEVHIIVGVYGISGRGWMLVCTEEEGVAVCV